MFNTYVLSTFYLWGAAQTTDETNDCMHSALVREDTQEILDE